MNHYDLNKWWDAEKRFERILDKNSRRMKGISSQTEAKMTRFCTEAHINSRFSKQSLLDKVFDVALTTSMILSVFGLSLVIVGFGIVLCKMALSL